MERPDLDDYKDEIHHPNGQIEDQWRDGEYDDDLEKYVDHLEKQLALFGVSGSFSAEDMEEAYNDGAGINTPRDFDIDNYR